MTSYYGALNVEDGAGMEQVGREEERNGSVPSRRSARRRRGQQILAVAAVLLLTLLACLILSDSRPSRGGSIAHEKRQEKFGIEWDGDEARAAEEEEGGGGGRSRGKKKAQVETSYHHFPDMVRSDEHAEEIFGRFRNLEVDEDGWMGHNVRVTGANGHYLNVNYRGRYIPNTHIHNLDSDDGLVRFGCTPESMVLEYKTPQEARLTRSKLSAALSSGWIEGVILSGAHIARCPKSKEPESILNAHKSRHEHLKDVHPTSTSIDQTLRKVMNVKGDGDGNPHRVILDTSYANLQDVFLDFEFSGETDMIGRHEEVRKQRDGAIKKKAGMKGAKVGEKSPKRQRRRLSLRSWWEENVVKPIVDFVTWGLTGIPTFEEAVAQTMLSLNSQTNGSEHLGIVTYGNSTTIDHEFAINYDFDKMQAERALSINPFELQQGPSLSIGKTVAIDILLKGGKVSCSDCWVRFYNGSFSWRVEIGGRKLAFMEMLLEVYYQGRVELEAQIIVTTSATIASDPIPIPYISIPIGPLVIGFSASIKLTIGVDWAVSGLYYKYDVTAVITSGFRVSLLDGMKRVYDGRIISDEAVGPVLKGGVSAKVYVIPMLGLIFTNVAGMDVGYVPSVTFELSPKSSSQQHCAYVFSISFNCEILLGVWVGVKTSFGNFLLAGWSQSWSILPGAKSINVYSKCISPAQVNEAKSASTINFPDVPDQNPIVSLEQIQAKHQEFLENGRLLQTRYPVVPSFTTATGYQWINSTVIFRQNCLTVCGNHNLDAVSSDSTYMNSKFYVCSLIPHNRWFHSYENGYNYPGATGAGEYYGVHCSYAEGRFMRTYDYYACLCKESAADLQWKQALANHNCYATCVANGGYPVASGPESTRDRDSDIALVCRGRTEGNLWIPGDNHGRVNPRFNFGSCIIAAKPKNEGGDAIFPRGANYECLCRMPSEPFPPQLTWELNYETSCETTCKRRGYYAVSATNDRATKDVCAFPNSGEGYLFGEMNDDFGAMCMGVGIPAAQVSTKENVKCLCARDPSQFLIWLPLGPNGLNCNDTCLGDNRWPVFEPDYRSRPSFVCSNNGEKGTSLFVGWQHDQIVVDGESGRDLCYTHNGIKINNFKCLCSDLPVMSWQRTE